MATIIRRLLEVARRQKPSRTEIDLVETVRKSSEVLAPIAAKARVEFLLPESSDPLVVYGDPVQLEQVVTNLLMNAVQAMPLGGPVVVRAEQAEPKERPGGANDGTRYACIRISDRGMGIANEDLQRVFEPFFTTKPIGEGTGLGLSVVHGIVRDHDGVIELESNVGEGAEFSVYFPLGAES
jgi:signal transduction histidine kinase